MESPRSSTTLTSSSNSSTSSSSSSRSKSSNSLRVTNLYKATMNRFLQRRKAQDALEGDASAPSLSKKDKKKNKNVQPEPKPELDLSSALPSNDQFRTSLLMPKMSARFSMLREQDDPSSILGKASDDSVLHPKRQSRLYDFGYNRGLSDIAEVASITGSVRPPFADERKGSIDAGYASDADSTTGGSIMSRKRPGEGNVLFGGRQKVYLGNRALYDDDVGLSPFQKMKQEEKRRQQEEGEAEEEEQEDYHDEEPGSPSGELKHSSSFTDSLRRRETSSSTTSGAGARASTAATSIASQGANSVTSAPALERSSTKMRRLYEQGLDRNIHEQQSSALNRLNSIQTQRSVLGGRATPPLSQSRSATGLNERFRRPSNAPKLTSPPPSAPLANMANFIAARDGTPSGSSSPVLSLHQTPPMSPLGIDVDENNPLTRALDWNDRGKATAMGAFNKPSKQFDQTEYLQRQKQMLEGRESPVLRRPSASRATQDKSDHAEGNQSELPFRGPSPSTSLQSMREKFEVKRAQSKSSLRSETRPVVEPQEHLEAEHFPPRRSRSRSNSSGVVPPPPEVPAEPAMPPPTSPPPPVPIQEEEEPAETRRSEESATRSRSRTNSSGIAPSSLPPALPPVSSPPVAPLPALPPPAHSPPKVPPPPTPNAFSVFQKAANRMRVGTVNEDETPKGKQVRQTFFAADSSESESESEGELSPGTSRRNVPEPIAETSPRSNEQTTVASVAEAFESPVAPPLMGHPALRSLDTDSPVTRATENLCATINSPQDAERKSSAETTVKSDATDIDSPTLGPESGGGLNGMIRQHLRQQSNVSSIYDDAPPQELGSRINTLAPSSMISDTPAHSSYSHSNPWDLEDIDGGFYGEADSLSSISPVDAAKAKALRSSGLVDPVQMAGGDINSIAPWEQDQKTGHARNFSTSTVAEREAFEKEIAERQRAIQETLKSKVEAQSRSGSPTPSIGGAFKAFGILRSKTSRDSLANQQESKGAKFFRSGANASTASLARTSEEQWRGYELGKSNSRPFKQPITEVEPDDDYRREFQEQLTKGASGDVNSKSRSPSQSTKYRRKRSSSNLSPGRSKSSEAAVDDLGPLEMPPPIPGQLPRSGLPTPDSVISTSSPEGYPPAVRARSNSRPAIQGYFDQKSLHPIQTGVSHASSPRVSPGLSPRPSPSAGPSPISPAPSTSSAPPTGRIMPRKKSIQKSIISEPMFVSSTSVVDTIELPPGASLKNGMDEAPPVPPINPMRRRFGFGRSDSRDSASTTSDSRGSTEDGDRKSRIRLRKSSNATLKNVPRDQENEEPMPPLSGMKVASSTPAHDGSMF